MSDDEDELEHPVGPRPRRLSARDLQTKTEPMPSASSFFIFTNTNPYVAICCDRDYVRELNVALCCVLILDLNVMV